MSSDDLNNQNQNQNNIIQNEQIPLQQFIQKQEQIDEQFQKNMQEIQNLNDVDEKKNQNQNSQCNTQIAQIEDQQIQKTQNQQIQPNIQQQINNEEANENHNEKMVQRVNVNTIKKSNYKNTSIMSNAQKAEIADQKRAQQQGSNQKPQIQQQQIQQQQIQKVQAPPMKKQQNQQYQQKQQVQQQQQQQQQQQYKKQQIQQQQQDTGFFGNLKNYFGNLLSFDQAEKYQSVNQTNFNDDDDIIYINKNVKQDQQINIQELIEIQVQAQYDYSKLQKTQSQQLPAMISIITKDIDQFAKANNSIEAGIDLFCVIDKSGSMSGSKIISVQKSLIKLLEFLSDKDRLCLITFESYGQRHTQLKCTTAKNKKYFLNAIAALKAEGGTNIAAGTSIAFRQIQQRKQKNQVTSIFLLSDGQDPNAVKQVEEQKKQIDDVVTIHSFGYGDDHDAKLMSSISNIGQGSFYYISNVALLDEFFADALGRLASAIAENIQLDIKCTPQNPFETISIIKTYGDMWNQIEKGKLYQIKIPQIASDSRKDFVFEFQLPLFDQQILDEQRTPILIQVYAQFKDTFLRDTFYKQTQFQLKLYNEDEQIQDNDPNPDVTKEYLRVKATEAIDIARQKCEQQKNEEAEDMLEVMIQNIQTDQKLAKVSNQAIEDIRQAKNASKRSNFNAFGQKQMYQMKLNNYQQEGINAQFDVTGAQMQQKEQAVFQNKKQRKMMTSVQTSKN